MASLFDKLDVWGRCLEDFQSLVGRRINQLSFAEFLVNSHCNFRPFTGAHLQTYYNTLQLCVITNERCVDSCLQLLACRGRKSARPPRN